MTAYRFLFFRAVALATWGGRPFPSRQAAAILAVLLATNILVGSSLILRNFGLDIGYWFPALVMGLSVAGHDRYLRSRSSEIATEFHGHAWVESPLARGAVWLYPLATLLGLTFYP